MKIIKLPIKGFFEFTDICSGCFLTPCQGQSDSQFNLAARGPWTSSNSNAGQRLQLWTVYNVCTYLLKGLSCWCIFQLRVILGTEWLNLDLAVCSVWFNCNWYEFNLVLPFHIKPLKYILFSNPHSGHVGLYSLLSITKFLYKIIWKISLSLFLWFEYQV